MVRIHCIQTGSLRLKQAFLGSPASGGALRYIVRQHLERGWPVEFPIYAWLIEHPEGLILVDSGDTASARHVPLLPGKLTVPPDAELPAQLGRLGFSPRDIRTIVLTHAHYDHINGLATLPPAPVLVSAAELAFLRSRAGRLEHRLLTSAPAWFDPQPLHFKDAPLGAFPTSGALTAAGDVHAVPTPGHTKGHLSVIVNLGDRDIMLAGDASYSIDALLNERLEGPSKALRAHRATLRRIREHAALRPTVYLPTHDWGAPQRLAELEVLRIPTATQVSA